MVMGERRVVGEGGEGCETPCQKPREAVASVPVWRGEKEVKGGVIADRVGGGACWLELGCRGIVSKAGDGSEGEDREYSSERLGRIVRGGGWA